MLPQYLDLLDKEHQEVFKKLAAFSDEFILAGGTAIMLQLGHRHSYDFDCFSQKALSDYLIPKVNRIFDFQAKPLINNSDFCLLKLKNNIDLHFVFHPYKNLKKVIKTGYIPISDMDDLAANKVNTIGRRGAWRDYVDLFFLLKWKKYTINNLVTLGEKKFQSEFNSKLFLEQLVYFKDLEITDTKFIKEKYSVSQIQNFLSDEVDNYLIQVF